MLPGDGTLAGKPRKPPLARLARFLRRRPVTACLLAALGALVALLAAGSARVVLHLESPRQARGVGGLVDRTFGEIRRVEEEMLKSGRGMVDHRHAHGFGHHPGEDESAGHVSDGDEHEYGHEHGREHGRDDLDHIGDEGSSDGHPGSMVKNAKKHERGEEHAEVAEGGCHRTFKAGFLDSSTTVCVTGM